jgi:hypothetical protein
MVPALGKDEWAVAAAGEKRARALRAPVPEARAQVARAPTTRGPGARPQVATSHEMTRAISPAQVPKMTRMGLP